MIYTGRWKADTANFKAWKSGELVLDPSPEAIEDFRECGLTAGLRDAITEAHAEGMPYCLYRRMMEEIGRTGYREL